MSRRLPLDGVPLDQRPKTRSRWPEYVIWAGMVARCHGPNPDPRYGGSGIRVCKAWRKSFRAFIEYVGPRPTPDHSIDRYPDPVGGYEPGNVRWATRVEQGLNRVPKFNHPLFRRTRPSLLGRVIVAVRKHRKESRSEVAKRGGMIPHTLRGVEFGLQRMPWADTLGGIAKAFGVDRYLLIELAKDNQDISPSDVAKAFAVPEEVVAPAWADPPTSSVGTDAQWEASLSATIGGC